MTPTRERLGDITQEMFDSMDTDGKLRAIFQVAGGKLRKLDCRIEKLERRNWLNTTLSGIGGLIGGACTAWFGKH